MIGWSIYRNTGGAPVFVALCESLEYHGEWMGDEFVTVTVKSPVPVEFKYGDYLEYRSIGERYYIDYNPNKIQKARRESYGEAFVYEKIKLYSEGHVLKDVMFKDYVLGDNGMAYSQQAKFSFYAESVEDLADRIQANLNEAFGANVWKVITPLWSRNTRTGISREDWDKYYSSSEVCGNTDVNISCDGISCKDALRLAYDQFALTYVIVGRDIIIGGTKGIDLTRTLEYGKGNGLYELEKNTDESQQVVTKMYAYGSSDNMPLNYYANIGKVAKATIACVSKREYIRGNPQLLLWVAKPWVDVKSAFGSNLSVTLQYNNMKVQANVRYDTYTFGKEKDDDEHSLDHETEYLYFWMRELDVDGALAFYKALENGGTVTITSGANVNALPNDMVDFGTSYPALLSIQNLMLPGFPYKSLKQWVLENGGSEDAHGKVTWHGKTAYFSNNALRPWIMSVNADVIGEREGAVYFDGSSNDVENIHPTIKDSGADVVNSDTNITDNGYLAEGTDISFYMYVADSVFDWAEAWSNADEEVYVNMTSRYCVGRSFKMLAKPKKVVGAWKLTLERAYDSSLQRYFPYQDTASGGMSSYAQVRSGDKFVVTGTQMSSDLVNAASVKLLEAALEALEEMDHPKVTYVPKIDEIEAARERDTAAEGESLYDTIRAGLRLTFNDTADGEENAPVTQYIDTLTIKENGNNGIPTFDVVLRDEQELTLLQKIQNQISSMPGDSSSSSSGKSTAEDEQRTDGGDCLTPLLFELHKADDGADTVIDPEEWESEIEADEEAREDAESHHQEYVTPLSIKSKYGHWTDYFMSALGIGSGSGGDGAALEWPLLQINNQGMAEPGVIGGPSTGDAIVFDKTLNGGAGGFKWGKTGGLSGLHIFDGATEIQPTISGDSYTYRLSDNFLSLTGGEVTGNVTLRGANLAIISGTLTVNHTQPFDPTTAADNVVLTKSETETLFAGRFVTVEFFESLFELHSGASGNPKIDTNADLSEYTAQQRALFNIKSMFGTWTEQYLSALGIGSDGSSGGVAYLSLLEDVNVGTLSPTDNGKALIYDSTLDKWVKGTAGIDTNQLNTILHGKTLIITDGSVQLGNTWYADAGGSIDISTIFTRKKWWNATMSNGEVKGDIQLTGNITPETNDTAADPGSTIGTTALRYRAIYVNEIYIGDAKISWDSTNRGLHLTKGVYSDEWVSSLGTGSQGGSGGMDWEALTDWDYDQTHVIDAHYLKNVTKLLTITNADGSTTYGTYDGTSPQTIRIPSGVSNLSALTITDGTTAAVVYTPTDAQPKTLTVSGQKVNSTNVLTVTAGTGTLAIALADNYGDTKSPYAAKDAHYVLAGPASGNATTPAFRQLAPSDISDLSLSNGVITIGADNSITPLTDAKIKADYEWWGKKLNSDGVVTGDITVGDGDIIINNNKKVKWKKSSGTGSFSMLTLDNSSGIHHFIVGEASTSNNGIDTYVRGSSIVFQTVSGQTDASLTVPTSGDTTPVFYVKKLKIGSIVISEDTTNHAIHVEQNGIYADTFVSSLGVGSQGGAGGIDLDDVWDSLTTHGDSYGSSKIDNNHLNLGTLTINGEQWNPTSGNKTINITTGGTITGASDHDSYFTGTVAKSASKWATARNFTIKDADSTNSGTAVSVDGSGANGYTLLLPSTIKATLTGNVTGNADTATKLKSKAWLWGNQFDGSQNIGYYDSENGQAVNANLSYVNNISMVGAITGCTSIDTTLYFIKSNNTISQVNIGSDTAATYTNGNSTNTPKLYVNGDFGVNGNVFAKAVELYNTSPYIDFHNGNSTDDYTTRIIENASGVLTVRASGSGATGLVVSNSSAGRNGDYIRIGGATIYWDSTNQGLHIDKGLYSDSFVSSLGTGSSGGSGGGTLYGLSLTNTTLSLVPDGQQASVNLNNAIGLYLASSNYVTGLTINGQSTDITVSNHVININNVVKKIKVGDNEYNPLQNGTVELPTSISGDYLPLTGGTLTGNLGIKGGHDLSQSNNGVSSTNYIGYYIKDKNNKRSAQYINTVQSDGTNRLWMSVTYNVSGAQEQDKGFGLAVDKQGNCTWYVDGAASFRTAIGVNLDNIVQTSGNQTIGGTKTFTGNVSVGGTLTVGGNTLIHAGNVMNYSMGLQSYNATPSGAVRMNSGINLDTIMSAGTYCSDGATTRTHQPYSGNYRLWHIVNTGADGSDATDQHSAQLLLAVDDGRMFLRGHKATGFGDWNELVMKDSSGNIGSSSSRLGTIYANAIDCNVQGKTSNFYYCSAFGYNGNYVTAGQTTVNTSYTLYVNGTGCFTNDISETVGSVDLSLSDNNITSASWKGFRLYDKGGRRMAQFINATYPNTSAGWNGFWISACNYDTSGTMKGDKGFGLYVDKDGKGHWVVHEAESFREAIGVSGGTGDYLPLTGGTLSAGSNADPLALNAIRGYTIIRYLTSNTARWSVGCDTKKFYWYSDGTSSTVFSILNNGNVGIGETNPSYKLQVSGTGYFTDNLTVGSKSTKTKLTIWGDQSTGDTKGLFITASDNTNRAYITWNGNVDSADYMNIHTGWGNVCLTPANRVLIGTTAFPSTMTINPMMYVSGTGYFTGELYDSDGKRVLDAANARNYTVGLRSYSDDGATNLGNSVNLNNVLAAGTYCCQSGTIAATQSNTPYTSGNYRLWHIVNTGVDGSSGASNQYSAQIILAPNEGRMFIRSHSGSSFGSWNEFATTGNTVTISDTQTISGQKTFSGNLLAKKIQMTASNAATYLEHTKLYSPNATMTIQGSDSAQNLTLCAGGGNVAVGASSIPNNLNSPKFYVKEKSCLNGNVGIGTAPSADTDSTVYKLKVSGKSYFSEKLTVNGFIIEKGTINYTYNVGAANNTNYAQGTWSGNFVASSSDMRLKDVVRNVELTLEDVARAPIFEFTYKDKRDDKVHLGTSAQYWQPILSSAIYTMPDNYLTMEYQTTALAAAVMTARTVLSHEERIKALEAENERLRNEIELLKAA